MAFTILNPTFINNGSGFPTSFTDWTVGANNTWVPADIAPDDHGVVGFYYISGTGTDNMIYQTGVFPDYALSINHRIQIEVPTFIAGTGAKVYFGATLVGTITGAGTWIFSGVPTVSDELSFEILSGTTLVIEEVIPADVMLVGGPQTLMPAYNPNVWYFDSINKTKPGFRYFVEVLNTSNVIIASYRYTPAITTGYAVVDLTKILQNFVDFDLTTTGIQKVPNSWYGYYLKVYDEYSVPYVYDDYVNPSGDLTSLQATTNIHTFNVGDQVTVAQTDGGVLKPMLQGLHTVIAPTVAGTSDLYIDVPWSVVGAGSPMGGQVIYADNRKTISVVQYTSSNHYIFNGSVPFLNWPSWNDANYKMTSASSTRSFLSSIPRDGFYVTEDQDLRLNFANYFVNSERVYFENDGGDLFYISTGTSMAGEAVISVNASPSTTMSTTVSGTLPLVKANTEYYDVWVASSGGTQYSEKIRIYIDRRCKINDYEIYFLDRMGSMGSFAFQLRDIATGMNDKSTFKRLAGGLGTDVLGNPAFDYASTAVGEQTYNVDFKETLQLTTNWMNDSASVYFQELISSPVTYLKVGVRTYVAVIVSTSSMKVERQKNTRMIKYTIDVRFANNQNINI